MSKIPYPTRSIITTADLHNDVDVFPILPGQDFLLSKNPEWSTGVKTSASGREIRNGYWAAPKYNFSVRHNVLRNKPNLIEVQQLVAFLNSCQGMLGIFYYWDQTDYQVNGDQFGTGDGTTTSFQLMRILGKGTTQATAEPVYALWQTPTISVGGTPVSGSVWSVSPTGELTFTSPPGAGQALTWVGKFLYLCRFDQDTIDIEEMVHLLWSQKGLKFLTVFA